MTRRRWSWNRPSSTLPSRSYTSVGSAKDSFRRSLGSGRFADSTPNAETDTIPASPTATNADETTAARTARTLRPRAGGGGRRRIPEARRIATIRVVLVTRMRRTSWDDRRRCACPDAGRAMVTGAPAGEARRLHDRDSTGAVGAVAYHDRPVTQEAAMSDER